MVWKIYNLTMIANAVLFGLAIPLYFRKPLLIVLALLVLPATTNFFQWLAKKRTAELRLNDVKRSDLGYVRLLHPNHTLWQDSVSSIFSSLLRKDND